MCQVPEVLMCYHLDGIVQKVGTNLMWLHATRVEGTTGFVIIRLPHYSRDSILTWDMNYSLQSVWPEKIRQMSIKVAQKPFFARKMNDFDTFTKIA